MYLTKKYVEVWENDIDIICVDFFIVLHCITVCLKIKKNMPIVMLFLYIISTDYTSILITFQVLTESFYYRNTVFALMIWYNGLSQFCMLNFISVLIMQMIYHKQNDNTIVHVFILQHGSWFVTIQLCLYFLKNCFV